jgi:hypothetical protein
VVPPKEGYPGEDTTNGFMVFTSDKQLGEVKPHVETVYRVLSTPSPLGEGQFPFVVLREYDCNQEDCTHFVIDPDSWDAMHIIEVPEEYTPDKLDRLLEHVETSFRHGVINSHQKESIYQIIFGDLQQQLYEEQYSVEEADRLIIYPDLIPTNLSEVAQDLLMAVEPGMLYSMPVEVVIAAFADEKMPHQFVNISEFRDMDPSVGAEAFVSIVLSHSYSSQLKCPCSIGSEGKNDLLGSSRKDVADFFVLISWDENRKKDLRQMELFVRGLIPLIYQRGQTENVYLRYSTSDGGQQMDVPCCSKYQSGFRLRLGNSTVYHFPWQVSADGTVLSLINAATLLTIY